ncbi:ROK family transcriptional regulator [uncultured Brevibacillus sp.]|uniref:ROK family transcriptional regulator n=1 Tax=uncultured Brevibacillus sp. TaxID=169970 RepID=UPI00259306A0|nr:ROK family transcriptional regulator [uncultured Brevibacillus sp.]
MFKPFIQDTDPKNHLSKMIYSLIYQHGPISRAELLEKSNVKQTTLARTIQELVQHKYIREHTIVHADRGRPPVLYQIEPACGYFIGLQISRLEVKIGLINLRFQLIEQKTFLMTSMHTPQVVVPKIAETIHAFMEKHHIELDQLLGIGIGTIGPLDRKKGVIVHIESSLAPGWDHVPIVAMLQAAFPVRIVLENAANMAALGEFKHKSPPVDNLLYCISSRGLGCGVIANGELLKVKEGMSGYGHMTIDINGPMCTCGRRGCLISYTSPYAILKELQQKRPALQLEENAQIDHVIEFLKQGDQLTKDIVMKSAEYFGVGLANIVNLFHSELVILNGSLIYEYPNYYEKVIETASAYLLDKNNVTFSQGMLKENAIMLGASAQVWASYFP